MASVDIGGPAERLITRLGKAQTVFAVVLFSLGAVLFATILFRVHPGLRHHTAYYAAIAFVLAVIPELAWFAFRHFVDPPEQIRAPQEPHYMIAIGFWLLTVFCAFLGWATLVNDGRAEVGVEARSSLPPDTSSVTQPATPIKEVLQESISPMPTTTVHPPIPTTKAGKISLENDPSSVVPIVRVELNSSPKKDMFYWVLRRDREYPGQWYPQQLAAAVNDQPLLKFAVALPLPERTYDVDVFECDSDGDSGMWKAVNKGPEEYLSGAPDGCRPLGRRVFEPQK